VYGLWIETSWDVHVGGRTLSLACTAAARRRERVCHVGGLAVIAGVTCAALDLIALNYID